MGTVVFTATQHTKLKEKEDFTGIKTKHVELISAFSIVPVRDIVKTKHLHTVHSDSTAAMLM